MNAPLRAAALLSLRIGDLTAGERRLVVELGAGPAVVVDGRWRRRGEPRRFYDDRLLARLIGMGLAAIGGDRHPTVILSAAGEDFARRLRKEQRP